MNLKKVIRFIPPLIWMMVIFYFSSRSTTGIGTNNIDRFLILKSFHLIEYAFLAILFSYALLKRKTVVIISYLYALSDELHQYFISGRTGRFRDTLIDLIGIFIGIFIYEKFILKIKKHKSKSL